LHSFLGKDFNFKKIKSKRKQFFVIHGDNDPNIPLDKAESLSKGLSCELIIIKNGWHLNGSSGWFKLPQCLEALNTIMKLFYEFRE